MKEELVNFKDINLDLSAWDDTNWSEIKSISKQFALDGFFNGDEFKCTVAAGIVYTILQNKEELPKQNNLH